MPSIRTYTRSFASGELSPEMFGRVDDAKFQSGAALMRNFIATPQGPAENRAGFEYVAPTKNNGVARLIPFSYSTEQTLVLEMGEGYIRFHADGGTILYSAVQPAFKPSAVVAYTVATPTVITSAGHPFNSGDSVVLAINEIGITEGSGSYPAGLGYGPYNVQVIDADTYNLLVPGTGILAVVTAIPALGGLIVEPNYAIGTLVGYSGAVFYRRLLPPGVVPGPTVAILDGQPWSTPDSNYDWYWLPADLTYEIPTPYLAADLFDIHYVQSNDIVTLVHPSYPPMELRRYSATRWTLTPIDFSPTVGTPSGVSIVESPGYKSRISSMTGNPAIIQTISNHTLAIGDGIYISGETGLADGFYQVTKIPKDGTGADIPNQLQLSDYDGNPIGGGTYSGSGTIQYGSKIYDIDNYYVVTTVDIDGIRESQVSSSVHAINNLYVSGSFNTISWSAVAGALRYYVYKRKSGLYGYIGQTTDTSFVDNDIAPDMGQTPPIYDAMFGRADNYPGAVSYVDQRRVFGGTNSQPQNIWMSKSGTESDFSYSLPVKDLDRVAFRVAARERSTIRHIVPLAQCILLTSSCEMRVSPINSDAITPTTVSVKPQSYIGSNNVRPSIINNSLVFCAARGGHVRELGYSFQANGFITGDLSIRATHLFDNLTIVDQAYSKAPRPIVWFVSSTGNLLGLTYVPEEQIGAWHQHTTDGTFESIAAVSEGNEDRLYAVINRTIAGSTVRYIERMASRLFDSIEECFFVDSGLSFDGTNTGPTTITASEHLAPDGSYDLTASGDIFAYPAITDLGDVIVLTGSDGKKYRFTILTASSTTTANAIPYPLLPGGLTGGIAVTFPATASWSWARNTFTGLNHLEGKTVSILADGAVMPQAVVTGGKITLVFQATVVHVGLPYVSDIQTLPLVLAIDGAGQGHAKNINQAWFRVWRSSGVSTGPDVDHLVQIKQRSTEPYGSPPALKSEEIAVVLKPAWSTSAQMCIRQSNPLPLSVVGMTLEVSIGG